MHEGYGSPILCVSQVTALAASYIPCRLLKIYIVWTSLKIFRSGDMALFSYHDDQRLNFFSTKNTPMVLDTITNGTVHI